MLTIKLCLYHFYSAHEFIKRYKDSSIKGNIPMLASACPGMICTCMTVLSLNNQFYSSLMLTSFRPSFLCTICISLHFSNTSHLHVPKGRPCWYIYNRSNILTHNMSHAYTVHVIYTVISLWGFGQLKMVVSSPATQQALSV